MKNITREVSVLIKFLPATRWTLSHKHSETNWPQTQEYEVGMTYLHQTIIKKNQQFTKMQSDKLPGKFFSRTSHSCWILFTHSFECCLLVTRIRKWIRGLNNKILILQEWEYIDCTYIGFLIWIAEIVIWVPLNSVKLLKWFIFHINLIFNSDALLVLPRLFSYSILQAW